MWHHPKITVRWDLAVTGLSVKTGKINSSPIVPNAAANDTFERSSHYCPNETACPRENRLRAFHQPQSHEYDGLGRNRRHVLPIGADKDTADCGSNRRHQEPGTDGRKSAENIVNGIAASKEVPFEKCSLHWAYASWEKRLQET